MNLNPLDALADLGVAAIERIWPDPIKRQEELRKLEELKQKGDLAQLNAHVKLMLKQADINLQDAKSSSRFQSGWRPAIGWVGAIALALMYIPKAIVMTFIWSWQNIVLIQQTTDVSTLAIIPFPNLGVTEVIGLLTSMLGIAIARTYDKKNKIDSKK